MSKTEHDKHIAGAGDDAVRKGHPALNDKQNPPEHTRDGAAAKVAKSDPSKPAKTPKAAG